MKEKSFILLIIGFLGMIATSLIKINNDSPFEIIGINYIVSCTLFVFGIIAQSVKYFKNKKVK